MRKKKKKSSVIYNKINVCFDGFHPGPFALARPSTDRRLVPPGLGDYPPATLLSHCSGRNGASADCAGAAAAFLQQPAAINS